MQEDKYYTILHTYPSYLFMIIHIDHPLLYRLAVRASKRIICAYCITCVFTIVAFIRGIICGKISRIRGISDVITYTIPLLVHTVRLNRGEVRIMHGGDQRGLYCGGGFTRVTVSVTGDGAVRRRLRVRVGMGMAVTVRVTVGVPAASR